MRNNKNKPKIADIIISPEGLVELNRILNSGVSHNSKNQAMNEIAGGDCLVCGSLPSKKLIYDVSDDDGEGTFIERYCDSCFEKAEI